MVECGRCIGPPIAQPYLPILPTGPQPALLTRPFVPDLPAHGPIPPTPGQTNLGGLGSGF